MTSTVTGSGTSARDRAAPSSSASRESRSSALGTPGPPFKRTHDVAVPDLIGFGQSDKPDLPHTLDLYARFVERLVDERHLALVTLE
jgi:pimeloyl-ACP methyl ester carboxylesterase